MSSPPKKRLSTITAWRGFISASASSAVFRARSSSPPEGFFSTASSKVTVISAPPPRLSEFRRRAASTRICRMARAAIRLKWSFEVAANSGDFANFSQASLTRAVGLSVALGSPRRTLAASRRNSS